MAAGNRANDNDGKGPGYELGDLEIVPTRRSSGELPVVTVPPVQPQPTRPSGVARGVPRNLTLADGDMGPALELDIGGTNASASAARALSRPALPQRVGPPAPPAAAKAASSAAAALANFGGDSKLDDDFEQGGFARLPALDVETVERRSAERVVAREPAADDPQLKERQEAEAVRALARFRDAPQSLLSSLPYAFHVASRLLSLRKERALSLSAQRERAQEHDAALVALGLTLLEQAADKRMEPLRAKVARVHEERAKVERADAGMARTREGNQRALGVLKSEAEHLLEQLAPYLAAEQEADAAHRKADAEVRRAQAMQKRVEIELRALEEATAATDPARIETLEAQLDQRRGVVVTLSGSLTQASEALGQARRALALARGTLDATEEKQRQLDGQNRARELEAAGEQKTAHAGYHAALRELAELARKQKLTALASESAAKVQDTETALTSATSSVVRFDRALTLYDRSALIKGLCLLAAVLALAVCALALR